MNFWDYLGTKIQISEETNVHQQHLSDEILEKGQDGIDLAIKILSQIVHIDEVDAHGEISVTVKVDGSPAIVFGALTTETNGHPRGTFFVGTKGVFALEPKFATTKEEAIINYPGELGNILSKVIEHLPKIAPKGIFQGDLMWATGTRLVKKNEIIGEKESITFKPNTITYSVDKETDPDLYDRVKNAAVGIVIHTQYAKINTTEPLENLKASYNVSSENFKSSPDVWITDARIKQQTEPTLSEEERIKINSIIHQIKSIKIDSIIFDELNTLKPEYLLKAFINEIIKKENVVIGDIDKFINKFEIWHRDRMEVEKSKLKTEKGKTSRDLLHEKNLSVLKQNETTFLKLLKVYKLIESAKDIIVHAFERNFHSPMSAWLREGDKWNKTAAEGFCVISTADNTIIKLINRLSFSKINLLEKKDYLKE